MQKYKCGDCGAIIDETEIASWDEPRGEFWGMPCSERLSGCPYCFGLDLEEYEEKDDDEEGDGDDDET